MGAVWSCLCSSETETSNAMAMTPAQSAPTLGAPPTPNTATANADPASQPEPQDVANGASVPQAGENNSTTATTSPQPTPPLGPPSTTSGVIMSDVPASQAVPQDVTDGASVPQADENNSPIATASPQPAPPQGPPSTSKNAIVRVEPASHSEQHEAINGTSVTPIRLVPTTKNSGSKRLIVIEGLTVVLELAKEALDGLPIPGAKGAIGATLKVKQQTESANSNKQTLESLRDYVSLIENEILSSFQNMDDHTLPASMNNAMDEFASRLDRIKKKVGAQEKQTWGSKWVLATKNREDLAQFVTDLQRAVDLIRTHLSLHNALSSARIEKGLDEAAKLALWTRVDAMPHAWYAAHDSKLVTTNATCLVGTRETVLQDIMSWIERRHQVERNNVFWLKGAAGVGKSTIARTISLRAKEANMLGGSFFFHRGTKDLEDVNLVIPTLAFHLAGLHEVLKSAIGGALQSHHGILEVPAGEQLQALIIEPLELCFGHSSSHPLIFVLDALDECSDDIKLLELLDMLVSSLQKLPYVRLLLTSRPEHPLQSYLLDMNRLCDLDKDANVRRDIHSYITDGLMRISKAKKNQVALPPEGQWPAEADQNALVERSGSLFVYAATALRYIDAHVDPPSALHILLAAGDSRGTKVYAPLDELYMQVLTRAFPVADTEDEAFAACRTILEVLVFARAPMNSAALEVFSGASQGMVRTILVKLGSVIESGASGGDIHIYHPSFRDFLVNPARHTVSGYAIEKSRANRVLTLWCLTHLRDAHMCDAGEQGSDQPPKMTISHKLGYACTFWCAHLADVNHGDAEVSKQLMDFASHHLLYWIEVMAWLNALAHVQDVLIIAYRWTATAALADAGTESLLPLLWHAIAWISLYDDTINYVATHRLLHPFRFTPRYTFIYTTHHDSSRPWIQIVSGAEIHWPAEPSFVESPDGGPDGISGLLKNHLWTSPHSEHRMVRCVAFAYDGSIFATGEDIRRVPPDGPITIWKTEDGSHVRTLQTSDDQSFVTACRSLSFSADGKTLASGHADGTLCLWDVQTGCLEFSLEIPGPAILGLRWQRHDKQLLLSTFDSVYTFDVDACSLASRGSDRGVKLSSWQEEEEVVDVEEWNRTLDVWRPQGESDGFMMRAFDQLLMMKKADAPRWTVAGVVPKCFPITCAGFYGNHVVIGTQGGTVLLLDVSRFTERLEHLDSIAVPSNSSSRTSSSDSDSSDFSILHGTIELQLEPLIVDDSEWPMVEIDFNPVTVALNRLPAVMRLVTALSNAIGI